MRAEARSATAGIGCARRGTMNEVSKNLMVARSPVNVWDRQEQIAPYDRERWIAGGLGQWLTMVGARRGGFGGGLIATLGAVLAVRAAMGRHDFAMARALDQLHAARSRLARQRHRARRLGRVIPRERFAVVDADGRIGTTVAAQTTNEKREDA